MTRFGKKYYDDIWGTIHRHDYCEGLANRLIQEYGKVKILDIGTACGFLVKTLRDKGCDAWGMEVSDYALANSCASGYVIKGDVRDIPFKDNRFDLVISQGLWEYIPENEVDQAFNECKRVGKKQWHNFDSEDQDNLPEHHKITIKPRAWWDGKKIGIGFDTYPKILVACPTYDGKEYCWQKWIDMAKNLTYPSYDIFVVDNSKTEDFYNKYKNQIPMVHLDFTGQKDHPMYRVCKSMAEVQRHFLKGDYAYWMNIEADVIPPPNIIEILMQYSGGDADWVEHPYPTIPGQPGLEQGIGCGLLSRQLMTDFNWDDTTIADDSPDSELWNWVQKQGKYKCVELWYVTEVQHLK